MLRRAVIRRLFVPGFAQSLDTLLDESLFCFPGCQFSSMHCSEFSPWQISPTAMPLNANARTTQQIVVVPIFMIVALSL
jgi:hypothetical protein